MGSDEELIVRGAEANFRVRWRRFGRAAHRLFKWYPTMAAGFVFIIFVGLVAVTADVIDRHSPTQMDAHNRLEGPGAVHWFGQDHFGRDLYSRTVHGARNSLLVGVSVASLTSIIGVAIGLVAGYQRRIDNVVMRFMDGMMAIPNLLLALALMGALGPSLWNVIIAIVAADTPRAVRMVRGLTLSLKERAFVEAAAAIGARPIRVVFAHILPNTLAPVTVLATYVLAQAMLIEASLSFLGAGVPPEVPSWGTIVSDAQQFILRAPWMAIPAGLALTLTVLSSNVIGDGLREIFDPKMRGTHA